MKNKLYNSKLFFTTVQQFPLFIQPATFLRLCLTALINLSVFTSIQAQTQFQKVFADPNFDLSAYDVHEVSDGYILCSEVPNIMVTQNYTIVIKTDLSGNLVWQRKFEGSWCKIKPVSTGGFILAGVTSSGNSAVYRIDNNGVLLWQKYYNSSPGMFITNLIETQHGGNQAFLLVGTYFRILTSGSATRADFLVIKTDASGSMIWAHCYGRNTFSVGSDLSDHAANVIETGGTSGNPNYLITGVTSGYNTSQQDELYVVKVNGTNGSMLFDKLYTPLYPPGHALRVGYTNHGGSIAKDNNGYYAIGGYTNNITSIDDNGVVQWCKNYSSSLIRNLVKDVNNTGYGVSVSFGVFQKTVLLKIAFNGSVSWAKNYEGIGSVVEATSDNGYLVAGGVSVSNVSRYGYLLAKTDASGQSGCYETSESISTTDVPIKVIDLNGDDVDILTDISVSSAYTGDPFCLEIYSRNCSTPSTFTLVSGGSFSYSITENNYPFPPFLSNYNITGANAAWNTTYDTKWTLVDAGITNVTEIAPFQYYSTSQPGFGNFVNAPVRNDKTLCVDVTRKSDGCRVRQLYGLTPPSRTDFRTAEESDNGHAAENSAASDVNTLQLMPNPASGSVTVTLPFQAGGQIEILDGSGLIVKRIDNIAVSELVDISTLKSGMYLVRVSHASGVNVAKLQVY